MNRKTWAILSTAAVALLSVILVRPTLEPTPVERRHSSIQVSATPSSSEHSVPKVVVQESLSVSDASAASVRPPAALPVQAVPAADEGELRHPGERADEARIVARYGDKPLTQEHPDIQTAMNIQERNNGWLMAHPAVVGTAIGLNDQGEIALIVYTKVDAPELPKAVEGLPLAAYRSGPIFARMQEDASSRGQALPLAKKGGGGAPAPAVDPRDRFARPVPIGVSTGHPAITAGTIGCRVIKDGSVFALSNNHVFANEGLASTGDNALQPGVYDGGSDPADAFGTLVDFEGITFSTSASNTMDAAIVLSSAGQLGNATPSNGYGKPSSTTASASLMLKVKKYGRTTVQTTGKVWGLNATVNIGYDSGTARFVGQIIVNPGSFSAGGDSGSLIVTQSGNRPVGLLFAGSSSITIANPINPVLERFGVTIDGE